MHMAEARAIITAATSFGNRHPNAMGYGHPYDGSSTASACYYNYNYGARAAASPSSSAAAFRAGQPAAGPSQRDDVFVEYLADEGDVRPAPAAVAPGGNAFGTLHPPPPGRMPVEHRAVYGHAASSGSAAAVATTTEGPTRMRTDRVAFRMRSDEEVLDDGYKWRKYGKKSVKNSPNPRNYYRCSTEGCNVKKRVERDRDEPSYVVTMYEGVHNHVSPGTIYYATQDAASGRFFVSGMQQHPGP